MIKINEHLYYFKGEFDKIKSQIFELYKNRYQVKDESLIKTKVGKKQLIIFNQIILWQEVSK